MLLLVNGFPTQPPILYFNGTCVLDDFFGGIETCYTNIFDIFIGLMDGGKVTDLRNVKTNIWTRLVLSVILKVLMSSAQTSSFSAFTSTIMSLKVNVFL